MAPVLLSISDTLRDHAHRYTAEMTHDSTTPSPTVSDILRDLTDYFTAEMTHDSTNPSPTESQMRTLHLRPVIDRH
jgi:hypothetical protein